MSSSNHPRITRSVALMAPMLLLSSCSSEAPTVENVKIPAPTPTDPYDYQREDFRTCYQRFRPKSSQEIARLDLQMEVDPGGAPLNPKASITGLPQNADRIAACIERAALEWRGRLPPGKTFTRTLYWREPMTK